MLDKTTGHPADPFPTPAWAPQRWQNIRRDYGWDDAFDSKGQWKRGPLHGYVYFHRNIGTNEAPRYAEPVYAPPPVYYAPPPAYYASPQTFYPPARPYYAPPPIYQTPSYGFVAPFR